ncbi:MAG: cupredoxin domain-containing protein [Caulobacteraceae bacterium]
MTFPIRIDAPRRALLGKAVLAAALIAAPAAFGQSTSGSSTGKEYTVVMSNMDYGALPPGLKVGDTIVWVNHDTVIHSVTARDHSFDLRLNPGQSGKLPLTTAGRVAFYCLFHPNMRGAMTVAAK